MLYTCTCASYRHSGGIEEVEFRFSTFAKLVAFPFSLPLVLLLTSGVAAVLTYDTYHVWERLVISIRQRTSIVSARYWRVAERVTRTRWFVVVDVDVLTTSSRRSASRMVVSVSTGTIYSTHGWWGWRWKAEWWLTGNKCCFYLSWMVVVYVELGPAYMVDNQLQFLILYVIYFEVIYIVVLRNFRDCRGCDYNRPLCSPLTSRKSA